MVAKSASLKIDTHDPTVDRMVHYVLKILTKEEVRLSTAITSHNYIVTRRETVDARHLTVAAEAGDVNLKQ